MTHSDQIHELSFRGRVAIVTGAYLAHESCQRNGHFYSVGGGKVSRVFIGSTSGIEHRDLSPESVAESIDRIDATGEWELR